MNDPVFLSILFFVVFYFKTKEKSYDDRTN